MNVCPKNPLKEPDPSEFGQISDGATSVIIGELIEKLGGGQMRVIKKNGLN
ncbi:MAG: hypothetical protein ACHQAX_08985 [Gammaproteobacteria bacterium]